ncbi:MAG: hypothetical protein M9948_11145 [Lentimicrobium sp.]|nr:hypothetical protein [Lentimicrobium sp.]
MKLKNLFRAMALVAVIATSSVFMFSCDKVKELAEFDVAYTLPDVHFSIDSTNYLPKTEQLLIEQTLTLNVDSIIQKHNLDGIGETGFEYVRLVIEDPDNVNFSWLNSSRVTVSAQNLAETQVAAITTVNPDGRTLDLQLTNTNVSSVISTGTFVLRVYADFTPPLPVATIGLALQSRIKMTVQPL